MKKGKKHVYWILVAIILMFAYLSFYVVYQGEQVLQFRLGKLVAIEDPGLHARWPFIDEVKFFDARLQTFNVESQRVLTADQKYVKIDYYVEWHVQNLPLFYLRTSSDPLLVQQLLQRNISDHLRAQVVQHTLNNMVVDNSQSLQQYLLAQVAPTAQSIGISVVDVRIMQVALPAEEATNLLQRMHADHEQQAATIRATGEAKAAEIYANAYNKNPEFYKFYHSLEAYQKVFSNKSNVIVLQPNSGFFKYFNPPEKK